MARDEVRLSVALTTLGLTYIEHVIKILFLEYAPSKSADTIRCRCPVAIHQPATRNLNTKNGILWKNIPWRWLSTQSIANQQPHLQHARRPWPLIPNKNNRTKLLDNSNINLTELNGFFDKLLLEQGGIVEESFRVAALRGIGKSGPKHLFKLDQPWSMMKDYDEPESQEYRKHTLARSEAGKLVSMTKSLHAIAN